MFTRNRKNNGVLSSSSDTWGGHSPFLLHGRWFTGLSLFWANQVSCLIYTSCKWELVRGTTSINLSLYSRTNPQTTDVTAHAFMGKVCTAPHRTCSMVTSRITATIIYYYFFFTLSVGYNNRMWMDLSLQINSYKPCDSEERWLVWSDTASGSVYVLHAS